jgi:CheY-like chemotaxis protein
MARVLVVDDEEDLRLVATAFLEILGHQVIQADSGERALDVIEGGEPDAMLLDIRMPGIDGWQVLDQLRSDGRLSRIAVVVVSAHADAALAKRALELGCRGYLEKPFSSAALGAALDDALSTS